MVTRVLLLSAVLGCSSASFFSPCGAPCSGGCPAIPPPCPPPVTAVCPQYPPCAGAATGAYVAPPPVQSTYGQVVDQFVQPLQQQQQYAQQPQYQQSSQYTQGFSGASNGVQKPTVIYLDQYANSKVGEAVRVAPQVTYQSLPSGGSRLIVPPGSNVYALNTGAGAPYQYAAPTVVYRTAQLNTPSYQAVEQSVDEMDLKGLEAGIPLQPTAQKRAAALEAIEKLAENAGEEEEAGLIRKVRSLMGDDVISREDKEEQKREYGEMIDSDEEVEMIGEAGGEEEEELEPSTPPKKSKKHDEKVQKSRRSSKKARAEDEAEEVNGEENKKKSRRSSKKARAEEEEAKEANNGEERNNDDLDRKKCNSRRLYEIMLENMNESSASSKRTINTVAEAEFGTSIDVICSRGHFSYVFSSNLYCEASKGHVTCIAFRQAPPAVTEE